MADLPDYLEEALDAIDAAIFSGDTFYDRKAVDRLKFYLDRWNHETITNYIPAILEQK